MIIKPKNWQWLSDAIYPHGGEPGVLCIDKKDPQRPFLFAMNKLQFRALRKVEGMHNLPEGCFLIEKVIPNKGIKLLGEAEDHVDPHEYIDPILWQPQEELVSKRHSVILQEDNNYFFPIPGHTMGRLILFNGERIFYIRSSRAIWGLK